MEHHPWVGILTLVEHRRAFAISAGTGLLLLLVLLAGADRPPPPGFLWLVGMVAVLVGAGTVVIPRWWERRQRVGRARMVVAAAAQGATVGLAVALVIALLPRSGAPEAGPAGWLIWFALLGFGGAVTAAMVAWVADLLRPRPPRPPAVSGSRDF